MDHFQISNQSDFTMDNTSLDLISHEDRELKGLFTSRGAGTLSLVLWITFR
jgi:hypothetical protein